VLIGNICVIQREPFNDSSTVRTWGSSSAAIRGKVTSRCSVAIRTTPCAGNGLLASSQTRFGSAGRREDGLMSFARITFFAVFFAGMASSCKQSSQATELAQVAAPAPHPATTQGTTAAPGQTAPEPPATQPAQPPEGMVYVPGGTFDMGPPQSVTLGKAPERVQVAPFFLDRNEVTVAAYLDCVRSKRCTASEHQAGCNATAKKSRSCSIQ
jgi:formylglycine-generating enzyme required for sulfatase activity